MKSVYRHADKGLKRLRQFAASVFQQASMMASWDELNVIRTVRDMYDRIDEFAQREYLRIAEKAYRDAENEVLLLVPPSRRRRLKGIDHVLILQWLGQYDSKTQYRYDHEWERKRDRLAESILSVDKAGEAFRAAANSNELRQALERGLRMIERQMAQMVDTVTDESRAQCYADAGIQYVMWNTQRDGKVCKICRERDGMQFPVFGVPSKHPNCRCYLTPVRNSDGDTD